MAITNAELVERLGPLVETEVCVGPWVDITQEKIDAFAKLTGDHQWIHVDPDRAKRESPFGCTIAHGIFTLALLPAFFEGFMAEHGLVSGVNYGCEKTRFPAPVPVGSRVRGPDRVVSEWLKLAWRADVRRRSFKVAVLVGVILAVINYADRILGGAMTGLDYLKIGLTLLVPYAVSTHASVSAILKDRDGRGGMAEATPPGGKEL